MVAGDWQRRLMRGTVGEEKAGIDIVLRGH